jgi:hypothetical protein
MRALGIGHSQGQLNIVGTFPELQALPIVNHKAKFIMNLKICRFLKGEVLTPTPYQWEGTYAYL